MRYWFLLSGIFLLFGISNAQKQTVSPDDRFRAIFIYNFTRYFEWANIDDHKDFRIGVLKGDSAVTAELREITATKKVGNHQVTIVEFNSLEEFNNSSKSEILYVNVLSYPNFKLDKQLKNTLVITRNNKNLFNAMISFIDVDHRIKFAFNAFLTTQAGIRYHPDFEALASATIKTGQNTEVNKEVAKKWSSIVEMITDKLKSGSADVTFSKQELQGVASQLNSQVKELKTLSEDNRVQKDEIQLKKQELAEQEKNIEEQNKVLESQKLSIASQGSKLYRQLAQINTQKTILWLSLAVVLIIVSGLGLLYRNFKRTQKINALLEQQKSEITNQHRLISQQKHLVDEKQKEITDSINYAQRIQHALLASEKILADNLGEHFVFFIPKDIVSGDFYWSAITADKKFILVTADSTGHGVPGAIMSMLNISSLEKALDKGLSRPSDILNFTRDKIIATLSNDGSVSGGKDGMDCSLISFDLKNAVLTYAAANNPVWIVRQNELIQFEPDKMPVGKHDKDQLSFTEHSIDLQKNDLVYVLTDGLPDQFGGPKGKKFMYKQLKELLISIASLPMHEQKQKLATSLTSWQGELEQVDDITVIGVRI